MGWEGWGRGNEGESRIVSLGDSLAVGIINKNRIQEKDISLGWEEGR